MGYTSLPVSDKLLILHTDSMYSSLMFGLNRNSLLNMYVMYNTGRAVPGPLLTMY